MTTTATPAKTAAKPKKAAAPKKPKAEAVVATPEPTPAPAAAPAAKQKAEAKPKKEKKAKVIRDSFTLPEDDYARLSDLKQACLKAGLHIKKSELVRAGLRLLGKLEAEQLVAEMTALEKIKTGRPKSKDA